MCCTVVLWLGGALGQGLESDTACACVRLATSYKLASFLENNGKVEIGTTINELIVADLEHKFSINLDQIIFFPSFFSEGILQTPKVFFFSLSLSLGVSQIVSSFDLLFIGPEERDQ